MFGSRGSIALLAPPYQEFICHELEAGWTPARGHALVWHLENSVTQRAEYDWLLRRPAWVPLFVVMPPAEAIAPILPMIPVLGELHARGVLPNGPLSSVEPVRVLLGRAPRDLPAAMIAYFARRGLLRDSRARALVCKIFEMAPTTTSISGVARRLYTSRRTLGRFFEARALPVPSHWLQFARLLYVAARLQSDRETSVLRIATHYKYPDGFTMSNQMKRLVGCRPTEVRESLGYEWFVEDWLERERNRLTSD